MTKKQREIVLEKCNGRCAYCGCKLEGTRWHVDHVIPVERKYVRKGGEILIKGTDVLVTGQQIWDGSLSSLEFEVKPTKLVQSGYHKPENHVLENMMPSCSSCNINKGSKDLEMFRTSLQKGVESLNKYHAQYKMAKRFGLIVEVPKTVVFYFETL